MTTVHCTVMNSIISVLISPKLTEGKVWSTKIVQWGFCTLGKLWRREQRIDWGPYTWERRVTTWSTSTVTSVSLHNLRLWLPHQPHNLWNPILNHSSLPETTNPPSSPEHSWLLLNNGEKRPRGFKPGSSEFHSDTLTIVSNWDTGILDVFFLPSFNSAKRKTPFNIRA